MQIITFIILVDMIIFWSMHKANHITIIANSSAISEISQHWSMIKTLFALRISIHLGKQYDCNVELFCQGF